MQPIGSKDNFGFVYGKGGSFYARKSLTDDPGQAWWDADVQKYQAKRATDNQYDKIDHAYDRSKIGQEGAGSGVNQFGGDWTQGNSDFSFDKMRQDMMHSAKEMSAMQLDHTKQMMGTASHYRNFDEDKASGRRMTEASQGSGLRIGEENNASRNREREYTGKTTDDMRRDNQQSIWQQRLQESNQGFQERTQKNQFGQEKEMFDKRTRAESESTRSARQAADNLFNRGSSFRGR